MKQANRGFWTRVDLTELSDAFRRHARFENQRLAAGLVREARAISVLLTHYRPEEPDLPENKKLVKEMRDHLAFMVGMAFMAEIDEIALPVTGDARSPLAAVLRDQVIAGTDWPIRVTLQHGAYDMDLSALGKIDRKVKTALDEGVRGMADIAPQVLRHW